MPIFRADCRIPDQDVLTLSPLYVQAASVQAARDYAQFTVDEPKGERRMSRALQRIDRAAPAAPVIFLSPVDLADVPDDVEILRADEVEPPIERRVHHLRIA